MGDCYAGHMLPLLNDHSHLLWQESIKLLWLVSPGPHGVLCYRIIIKRRIAMISHRESNMEEGGGSKSRDEIRRLVGWNQMLPM